jgi:oligopeptide/dipeptide ABC transporter ATP-binding protein
VIYLGKLVEVADVNTIYANARHPYTVALLSAVPDPDPRIRKKRLILKGDVPSPANPPTGCRFHTRCWLREKLGNPADCAAVDPPLRSMGNGQMVACHYADKVTTQAATEVAATQDVIQALEADPE